MGKVAIPETKSYYVFNCFIAGLKPKEIINMKRFGGKNYFLVKWGQTDDPTYVEAEVFKKKCPLLVCEFYQKHIIIDNKKILCGGKKRNL